MSTDVHATPTSTTPTRRERQREATYTEIVRASRELLAEGAELSLRAVASRMGMTAPALYRYVSSYQELIDLVAFEIDKAATETFAAAADALPEDDYAGRLVASTVEFRMWALANPREFGLAFAAGLRARRGLHLGAHRFLSIAVDRFSLHRLRFTPLTKLITVHKE